MSSILVTGISGFIGGHVWAALAEREDIQGVYGASGEVPLRPERQLHADLSIIDSLARIVAKMEPRCILHLAAISSPIICGKQSLLCWRVNHAAVRELARAAQQVGARLILASSDQVFDGIRGNYREGDTPDPINVYGETKKAAERVAFSLCDDTIVARINIAFGRPKFFGSSFSEWILAKEERGEPITLFNDQYRSPIDVLTLIHALIELIDHPFKGIIHLGGANRVNRVTFGKMLLRHLGRDSSGIFEMQSSKLDPEGTIPVDTSFDITLANTVLDTPIPGIEEGIRITYAPQQNGI